MACWMVPFHPRHEPPVGRGPGAGEEIRSHHQRRAAIVGGVGPRAAVKGNDGSRSFATGIVILPHAENEAPVRAECEIGKAQAVHPAECAWCAVTVDQPYGPVHAVAEHDPALCCGIGPAAIFMHARADIERRWGHVARDPIAPAHQHAASCLRRASLDPVDVRAIGPHVRQPQRGPGDKVGADG